MENRTTAPEVLEAAISEIVRTNGKILEEYLGEMVRSTVEEALNRLLGAPCGSHLRRGALRAESGQGGGAGHYRRKLKIKAEDES